ncbi:MAG: 50S ribosomal protein L13 [Myxococcota bacterium]
MKTVSAKKEDVKREWYVVDAADQTLGRLATRVATVLRGKHKPIFTPHVDTGDFVVVINAEKVRLTGKKGEDKMYHHHTGWIGGVVSRTAKQLRETRPEKLIENAVHGMLPKNVLGRQMGKKLKVYAGAEHPHAAQQPRELAVQG